MEAVLQPPGVGNVRLVFELPGEMRTEPNLEREPPTSPVILNIREVEIVPPPMEELEGAPPMAPSMQKIPSPRL
jgi:hypothetical protein